jgi:hypothetical protein
MLMITCTFSTDSSVESLAFRIMAAHPSGWLLLKVGVDMTVS